MKNPNSFDPNSFEGLPFWSFWKHELPRVTSFMVSWTPWNSLTFLRYPTKTQQETKPFEGPFQSFHLSNPPVLMMFKWFLWLQNRGTCSFILLPDVYIVYGSLEWFYWNIPLPWGMLAPHPSQKENRLTNVTTRASILRGGEHLKHSLIFFSLWMIESECSKRCLLVLYRGWNTNQLYGNYTVRIPVNQLL